jgi:hypothetical protein
MNPRRASYRLIVILRTALQAGDCARVVARTFSRVGTKSCVKITSCAIARTPPGNVLAAGVRLSVMRRLQHAAPQQWAAEALPPLRAFPDAPSVEKPKAEARGGLLLQTLARPA